MAAVAVSVKAVARVKVTAGGLLSNLRPSRAIDSVKDLIGRSLYLELVSSQLDAKTGQQKPTLQSYAHQVADNDDDVVTYEADFDVAPGFGAVGAVLVTNEHHFTEMFLEDIKIFSSSSGPGAGAGTARPLLTIRCKSWVQPKSSDGDDAHGKRVFFANKVQ